MMVRVSGPLDVVVNLATTDCPGCDDKRPHQAHLNRFGRFLVWALRLDPPGLKGDP